MDKGDRTDFKSLTELEDSLASRIEEGLREMKIIEDGKLSSKSARAFLDEI